MMEEIQSVMQGKTALPLNDRQRLIFTGSDRARYLNGQTTNDVTKLTPGHALHAAVCNAKGKMHGEIIVANDGERLLVDLPVCLSESLPLRLEKYIIADDVEIQEPEAVAMGYHMIGEVAPELPEGAECYVSSRYQQPGFDIWLPDSITTDFPVATEAATEWIRIQSGIPKWDTDISENNMPPEAYPEMQTISYRKGCYIGQEVIAKIKSIGQVKKKLCLLQGSLSVETLPAELTLDGRKVGQLTSVQQQPDADGLYHALGMVQTNHSEPETEFEVSGQSWKILRTCN
ncbi:MAG: hypothetical protein AAF571_12900 [Verrucomicrobiota bacterium]